MTIKSICVAAGLTLAIAMPAQAHSGVQLIETAVMKPAAVQSAGTRFAQASGQKTNNTANKFQYKSSSLPKR